jgi:hypothetical protein
VRADLSVGVAAAQLVHAAGHSVVRALPSGVRAVVVVVDDEPALRRVAARLSDAGLSHHVVHEPAPPFDGAATAIGVVPIDGADRRLRWAIARLPLYPTSQRRNKEPT